MIEHGQTNTPTPEPTPSPTPEVTATWMWGTPTPRPEATPVVEFDLDASDMETVVYQYTDDWVSSYNHIREPFEAAIWLLIAFLIWRMFRSVINALGDI